MVVVVVVVVLVVVVVVVVVKVVVVVVVILVEVEVVLATAATSNNTTSISFFNGFNLSGGSFEFSDIPKASLWLHGKNAQGVDFKGNAVAVTANRALSSLHGLIVESSSVELVDIQGTKRKATVVLSRFIENEVDMALLELIANEPPFDAFIEIRREPVQLGQKLALVGLASNSRDDTTIYYETFQVTLIDAGALLQSSYHGRNSLSGSAVIVSIDTGGFHVVGVHVGTNDDTVKPPPIKKGRKGGYASADDVEESQNSLAGSLHGHTAYCLICEVARVSDIVNAF